MAISASEIKFYLSERIPLTIVGTAGGSISTDLLTSLVNTLFPTRAARATGGSALTFFAKVFLKNTNGSQTMTSLKVYLLSQEYPSAPEGPQIFFALEESGGVVVVDGTDTTNPPTQMPANLSGSDFSNWDLDNALIVGGTGQLGPGQGQGIWLMQILPAGLTADAYVSATLAWIGNTPP